MCRTFDDWLNRPSADNNNPPSPPTHAVVVLVAALSVARGRSLAQSDMPTFTLEEVSQNGAR